MTPERIILDRRDDWWGAKTGFQPLPAMKRVIFVPFTTHEQAAQLIANGEVDTILEAHVPVMKSLLQRFPDKITTFSGNKSPYGNIDWWPTSLLFNHTQKQFQDIRIRRAVSLYLNRKQAVDYAYQGAAAMSGMPFPHYPRLSPYFGDMDAHDQAAIGSSTTTPTAADALMTEAGAVKDGSTGVWTLDGEQMGGDLYYPNSLDAIAPVIAEQLRRAGFKVAPTPGRLSATRSITARPRGGCGGMVRRSTTRSRRWRCITSGSIGRSARMRSGRHAGATTNISASGRQDRGAGAGRSRRAPAGRSGADDLADRAGGGADLAVLSPHPVQHDLLEELAERGQPVHQPDILAQHRQPDAAWVAEGLARSRAIRS